MNWKQNLLIGTLTTAIGGLIVAAIVALTSSTSDPPPEPPVTATSPVSPPTNSTHLPPVADIYGEDMVVLTMSASCGAIHRWETGKVSIDGTVYQKGHQVGGRCSGGETASAAFVLGKKYSRFTMRIGIIDTSEFPGPAPVEVLIDEQKVVYDETVSVGRPLEVNIDVKNVVRVTVKVTLEKNFPPGTPIVGLGGAQAQPI